MQALLTPAEEAYEGLAPYYDELTREHDYDGWTRHLEEKALRFGVRGTNLLDAACGTGKSFLPFLGRGYTITACDISPQMVDRARAKAPAAEVSVADIRRLGRQDLRLVKCQDARRVWRRGCRRPREDSGRIERQDHGRVQREDDGRFLSQELGRFWCEDCRRQAW